MQLFYPNISKFFFLSDNTFGGVCMQAWMKKEIQNYPQFQVEFLDGRRQSFLDVNKKSVMHRIVPVCWLEHGEWIVRKTMYWGARLMYYMTPIRIYLYSLFHQSDWGIGH